MSCGEPFSALRSKNVCEKNPDLFLRDFEKAIRLALGLAVCAISCGTRTAKRLIDFLGGHSSSLLGFYLLGLNVSMIIFVIMDKVIYSIKIYMA